MIAGLWAAGWVSQWVGAHWQHARPAVGFAVLRVIIVVLVGLTVAAVFRWSGERLRSLSKDTVAGWLDRPAGFVLGAGFGVLVVAVTLLVALLLPWPRALSEAAAESRVAKPAMAQAAKACSAGARFFPGSWWLHQRFSAAERRAARLSRPS